MIRGCSIVLIKFLVLQERQKTRNLDRAMSRLTYIFVVMDSDCISLRLTYCINIILINLQICDT